MKQEFKEYVDFIMPLVIIFLTLGLLTFGLAVAINFLDESPMARGGDFKNYFETKFYSEIYLLSYDNVLEGFLKHIRSEFIIQLIEGRYFIYALDVIFLAMLIRCFSTDFTKGIAIPLFIFFVIYATLYEWGKRAAGAGLLAMIIGLISMFLICFFYIYLKLYFANKPKIKTISYILTIILFGMPIFMYYNFNRIVYIVIGSILIFNLIIFVIIIVVSILFCYKNKKNPNMIIPNDIKKLKNWIS